MLMTIGVFGARTPTYPARLHTDPQQVPEQGGVAILMPDHCPRRRLANIGALHGGVDAPGKAGPTDVVASRQAGVDPRLAEPRRFIAGHRTPREHVVTGQSRLGNRHHQRIFNHIHLDHLPELRAQGGTRVAHR